MKTPVFLINLDSSSGRLETSRDLLATVGWEFRRVSAFDGRGRDLGSFADYDEQAALKFLGRPMNGGELGCFYSHRDAARQFLETGATAGVVLEDDMSVTPEAARAVEEVIDWLITSGQGWDLVNLSPPRLKIASQLHQLKDADLTRAHYFPVTTTGLIWSRRGAEAFLADTRKIRAPVDNYFRDWLTRSNTGLSVAPALITPRGVPSDIAEHSGARKNVGRTRNYTWLRQKRLMREKGWALWNKYLK